jgi:hypothetical protein
MRSPRSVTVDVAPELPAIAVGLDDRLAYVTRSSALCSVIDLRRVTSSAW